MHRMISETNHVGKARRLRRTLKRTTCLPVLYSPLVSARGAGSTSKRFTLSGTGLTALSRLYSSIEKHMGSGTNKRTRGSLHSLQPRNLGTPQGVTLGTHVPLKLAPGHTSRGHAGDPRSPVTRTWTHPKYFKGTPKMIIEPVSVAFGSLQITHAINLD
jgi:hypothetical protein